MKPSIPSHAHFIWIGPQLPWFAGLAIRTALRAWPEARVTLWATHDLARDAQVTLLRDDARFELTRLDEQGLFDGADRALPVDMLARLFAELSQPAARANIARLLILARFGGVYLDTDTVTLRPLTPLLARGAFCGLEHVVWPISRRGHRVYRVLGGPAREVVRYACAMLPLGEVLFERVSPWYDTAANNAVLGCSPGHPFVVQALRYVESLSESERRLRYRLGTHLLQHALDTWGATYDVSVLPPAHFYPLGPQISRQYFRPRSSASLDLALRHVVRPETYVIHWYASVSELAPYDEARARAERDRTLFGRITARALGWA